MPYPASLQLPLETLFAILPLLLPLAAVMNIVHTVSALTGEKETGMMVRIRRFCEKNFGDCRLKKFFKLFCLGVSTNDGARFVAVLYSPRDYVFSKAVNYFCSLRVDFTSPIYSKPQIKFLMGFKTS